MSYRYRYSQLPARASLGGRCRCVYMCGLDEQVALNYLDSQPRPGQMEARLLKMAGVK